MATTVLPPKTIWRGNPVSATHKPDPVEIVRLMEYLQSLIASGTLGDNWKATRTLLNADLAHAAGEIAVVYADTAAANNGTYVKSGASGSGSWTQITNFLPGYQVVTITDDGGSTANAYTMDASPYAPSESGAALFIGFAPVENTSTAVTISFDGGATTYPVKTASGGNPPVGSLTVGLPIVGMINGANFRLTTDLSGAAIQAAAEAAQAAAEAAQAAAEAAAASTSGLTLVETRTAMKALDEALNPVAFLYGEIGRTGSFVWSGSDLSAEIGFMSVTSTAVNSGTGVITKANHLFNNRQAVFVKATINGIAANTIYYVIVVDEDTFRLASTWSNAVAGTAITLTGTTNFTLYGHIDPVEAVYVIPTGKAFDGSEGAWVRELANPREYLINWGGASGAANIRPIFDSMKELSTGGALLFDAETYVTSDTLEYEARTNEPIDICGVSETETVIQNQGTGFTIQYYGRTGSANEVRGGGVNRMKLEKSGSGTCSGVDIANAYRGKISQVAADGCGNIGFRITGRGAGDQDATAGFKITQCRARSGIIGCQIKGATSGSIVCAEILIEECNFDNNATTNLWLANCDKVEWYRNTMTQGGHGASSTLNSRGCFYVESHGIVPKNLKSGFNEYGNSYGDGTAIGIIDSVAGFTSESDRWIRNNGESAVFGILFALVDVPGATIGGVRIEKPFINAGSDAASFTFLHFGAGTQTFQDLIVAEDVIYNEWNSTYHTPSSNTARTVFTKYGKDVRLSAARVSVTGSGTVAISTNTSLYHLVTVNAGGGTAITVSGEKHEGDIMTLTIANSSGGATTITPSTGFSGTAPPTDSGAHHSAQFRYSGNSDTWVQATGWGRVL